VWSVDPPIDTQVGREREEVEGRRGREREGGWERWRGRVEGMEREGKGGKRREEGWRGRETLTSS